MWHTFFVASLMLANTFFAFVVGKHTFLQCLMIDKGRVVALICALCALTFPVLIQR